MKNFTLYLLLSMFLSLVACSEKEVPSPTATFNLEAIKQSAWKGTVAVNRIKDTTVYDLGILFTTASSGSYELVGGSGHNFNYAIDGKLLAISGYYAGTLAGEWMVIAFSGDKLLMKAGLYSEHFNKILTLERSY